MPHLLRDMSSPEFARLAPQLAFVPVGATEQHGPNLGMGIDYRVAEEIAQRAGAQCDRATVVLPPIPYGLSDHHLDFPGTVSISFDGFRRICVDVALSLKRHGVTRVVFVNGHFGNMSALSVISTELKSQHGIRAATAFWMSQAKDQVDRHKKTHRWGHACEVECSVALAVTPELVKHDALQAGDLIEEYSPLTDNYQPHSLALPLSFAERTRNGAFGDATQLSEAAGNAIADAAVARLVEFAESF
ncbi:MAG: creatininase family protein [Micromonosporaceae bacterium]